MQQATVRLCRRGDQRPGRWHPRLESANTESRPRLALGQLECQNLAAGERPYPAAAALGQCQSARLVPVSHGWGVPVPSVWESSSTTCNLMYGDKPLAEAAAQLERIARAGGAWEVTESAARQVDEQTDRLFARAGWQGRRRSA